MVVGKGRFELPPLRLRVIAGSSLTLMMKERVPLVIESTSILYTPALFTFTLKMAKFAAPIPRSVSLKPLAQVEHWLSWVAP